MASIPQILVVEDDPDQQALYLQLLKGAGYAVSAASDGGTALTQLADKKFDLVITDYMLPDTTGDSLVQSIRQQGDGTKTILMSNTRNIRSVAQVCAADQCYQKGDIFELLAMVRPLLQPDGPTNPS